MGWSHLWSECCTVWLCYLPNILRWWLTYMLSRMQENSKTSLSRWVLPLSISFLQEQLEETFSKCNEWTTISLNSDYPLLGNTSWVMFTLFWLFEYNLEKKRGGLWTKVNDHSSIEYANFHCWGYNLRNSLYQYRHSTFKKKKRKRVMWICNVNLYVLYSCCGVLAKWQELRIYLYVPKRQILNTAFCLWLFLTDSSSEISLHAWVTPLGTVASKALLYANLLN